jgi:hypothetical protein
MASVRFITGAGATEVIVGPLNVNWNMSTSQADRVAESLTAFADTGAAARTLINGLERMFDAARSRYSETGGDEGIERVYIEYKVLDADAAWWRAEVFGGVCDAGLEAHTDYDAECMVRFGVAIERENAWEGPEANLTMISYNDTDSTVVLPNDWRGTVGIADNAIANSDLPVRVKLRIKNDTNTATKLSDVFVGVTRGGGYAPELFFEAESATPISSSTLNASAGAAYSNNGVRTFTWSGTAETSLGKWAVDSGINNYLRGGSLTPIMRVTGVIPSGLQLRLVATHNLTPVSYTPWVEVTQELQQFGRLRLPARYVGVTSTNGVEILLQAKISAAGSHTVELDYFLLAGRDLMKLYRRIGAGVDYGNTVVDDPFAGLVYLEYTVYRVASFVPSTNEPASVRPNEQCGFVFLHRTETGSAPANRNIEVTATYRPRRRSI